MILETQQNSDITYRVYDYDRLSNGKPRELHVEKSIDVITVPAKSVEDSVKSAAHVEKNKLNELYSCQYYKVFKIELDGKMEFEQEYPFLIMSGRGCTVKRTAYQKGRSLYSSKRIWKSRTSGKSGDHRIYDLRSETERKKEAGYGVAVPAAFLSASGSVYEYALEIFAELEVKETGSL